MARVLLVLLVGVLVAGCGGKDTAPSRFLPERDAAFLRARVDQAQRASNRDECATARDELSEARSRVSEIRSRSRVSKRLTDNVTDWLAQLGESIANECGQDPEPIETPTPEPTETPEETPTPDDDTETEPEETPTPDETPTPEPTSTPTPQPSPGPTPDNGGAPPEIP